MSYLKRQYSRLQNYMLERKLQQTSVKRNPGSFHDAQKIGILFNATDTQQRQIVLAYADTLRQKGKNVKLLAFYEDKKTEPNFTFPHFTRKDINFLQHPGGRLVEEFLTESFDILFNLFLEEETSLEYITALSPAQLRVGSYTEKTYCYDLMIDTSNRKDLSRLIEQIEFLLPKMNNKPHETTSA